MTLLFRILSFLLHLPIALLALAVGAFGLIDGAYNMNVDFLPWTGKGLVFWLVGLGIFGLFSLLQAIRGRLRFLFALYAFCILILAVNGAFLSTHRYDSVREFQWTIGFVFLTFLAFLGAIFNLRPIR